MVIPYILLFAAIVLGVVGQLLLKQGMSKRPGFQLQELLHLVRDPAVVGGFLSYGFSVLIYFKVLETVDLSLAYPTVSLGYVLIILFSKVFFKESVSRARWAAVFIICLGVVLVGLGS